MKVTYDYLLDEELLHKHSDEDVPGLNSRLTLIEDGYEYYEIFESTSSGTGQVSVPTGGTIILDFYPEGVDALAVKLDSEGRPMDQAPLEADGTVVTTTFDINGNYVLSGVPTVYPIGIVYFIKIQRKDAGNILEQQLVQYYYTDNEKIFNKVSIWSATPNEINYPSEKLTYDSIEDAKAFAVAMAAAL